ncbi:MAG TPA: erythromycin esterase family protein [Candidatus Melainabacteria bacterium]|nr:erythromycin esterase family protein [Candidatus Melainabacteria bacterium]HIN66846.1 erythromycin esterase family protein [Candidatus Obscuribacterales bacterium]
MQIIETPHSPDAQLSKVVQRHAIPYTGEKHELDTLMDLVGDASFVLIGEASHGTHEYYKTRIDLTKRLIEEKGFNVVAAEADWPDALTVNRYVKGRGNAKDAVEALRDFQRFPTWLWRNADVLSFIEWLEDHNCAITDYDSKVGFYGIDLYSLYRSVDAVIKYLEPIDQDAAKRARERYSCLSAYGYDEQAYGYAASLGLTKACEENIIDELVELQKREFEYLKRDGAVASDEFFFAEQNAVLIAHAQAYYREMFRGRMSTWNLRDTHMVRTLLALREHMKRSGKQMKAVIWAHNSHLGDARATEMAERGELNVGQLIRQQIGDDCRLIGFSGYSGTVTAASTWGGAAERKNVRPGMLGSYEHLFNKVDLPAFILPLKATNLVNGLKHPRLQRAIGVLYIPQTERFSHYFFSTLPGQFDAIIHFQETQAVAPLEKTPLWVDGEDRIEELID